MKRDTLAQLLAALLLGLFLYAALSKLLNYPQFASQLGLHPLLRPVAGTMAWALPAVEIVLSACLFVPAWRLAGLYAAFLMLLLFSVYILGMLLTASHLPCSCGGILRHLTWRQHLIFNLAFLGIAWWGIRVERNSREDRLMTERDHLTEELIDR